MNTTDRPQVSLPDDRYFDPNPRHEEIAQGLYATVAELPLVCVNVQRGGPSTGIPTKSEQSDLFQACFSAHGDSVRPVLSPISVKDTFYLTVEAFNIAEEYQTPVILLSDQEIAQRKETLILPDTSGIEVKERHKVRRAKLHYLRSRRGKAARLKPLREYKRRR